MQTIRQLRTGKGWSQAALADSVGVIPGTIHKWERSISVPRVDKLRELARVFGVRIDEIDLGDGRTVDDEGHA